MKPVAATAGPSRRWRPHGRTRRYLQRLHLWLGLGVGLPFALVAASGSVLVWQDAWLRHAYPQLSAHALPDGGAEARVLACIAARTPEPGLRAVDLPRPGLPVWQLYFADGRRVYVDPATCARLLERPPRSDLPGVLYDWHLHLLSGERGRAMLGLVGLLALFLLVSGPLLWWPGRRQLATSLRPRAQPPARRWLSWHRSSGVLSLPLLAVATLTGVLMVYGAGSHRVLQVLFADPPSPSAPAAIPWRSDPVNWAAVLESARQALPGAVLHRVSMPRHTDGRVAIRARAPGEWHQVGRSTVWLDPWSARVLGRHLATTDGRGARINQAVYPLHSGGAGGLAWRLALTVAGLLPAFFLLTGYLFWRVRTRRR